MLKPLRICLAALAVTILTGCSADTDHNPADFTLQSAGGPVSLHDFRGKVVLLFFGYTHCPDICPLTLNHIAAALKQLKPSERAMVQPIFITVDPQRDTPEHLAEYLKFFDVGILGLSGSEDAIQQTARAYVVEYHRDEAQDDGGYTMMHTSLLFLLGRDGSVVDMMSHNTSPEDISRRIRRELSFGGAQHSGGSGR